MPNTIYNPLTGNFDYVIDDAAEVAYTPADPADWAVVPDDTKEALDSLADAVASISVGIAPDATTTTKGIVKLAGDLGGTADLPTVPEMFKKDGTVAATGNFNLNNKKITNLANPTTSFDATNKSYVDNSVTSILSAIPVERVALATVYGDLAGAAYYPGPNPFDPGVGASLFIIQPGSPVIVDGVEIQVGDLILVKDMLDPIHNGVYQVYSTGGFGLDAQLGRHPNFDQSTEIPGSKVSVIKGSQNVGKLFVANAPVGMGVQFNIGVDPINYFEPSGNFGLNVGGGDGLFKQKVGPTLEFKSLLAGSNITLTTTSDNVTINSAQEITGTELLMNASYAPVPVQKGNMQNSPMLGGAYLASQFVFYSASAIYFCSPSIAFPIYRHLLRGTVSSASLVGITNINNTFIALSGVGTIYTSAMSTLSGLNSTSTFAISAGPMTILSNVGRAIASSASICVAVGSSTTTYATSTDGITWTSRTFNVAPAANIKLFFSNTLFFLLSGGTTYLTSTDGITWTSRTNAAVATAVGIVFANSIYVAITPTAISTSADGITWTARTNPLGTDCNFTSVTYSSGANRFVISGDTASKELDSTLYSTDGITWSIGQAAGGYVIGQRTGSYYAMMAFDQKLVPGTNYVGRSWKLLWSRDGINFIDKSSDTLNLENGTYVGAVSTVLGTTLLFGTNFNSGGVVKTTARCSLIDPRNPRILSVGPGEAAMWENNRYRAVAAAPIGTANDIYFQAVYGNNMVCTGQVLDISLVNSTFDLGPTSLPTTTATYNCIAANYNPSIVSSAYRTLFIGVSSQATDSLICVGNGEASTGIVGVFNDIAVLNNVFIAVGNNGLSMKFTHADPTPDATVASSWSTTPLSSVSVAHFQKIIAGNGIFMALGASGLATPLNAVSSNYGASWTAITIPITLAYSNCAFVKDKFFVWNENILYSSVNGITWVNEGTPPFARMGVSRFQKCGRNYIGFPSTSQKGGVFITPDHQE